MGQLKHMRVLQNVRDIRYAFPIQLFRRNQGTQKQGYLKRVSTKIENDVLPSDWYNAKPYNEMPGPKPLPLMGNLWRFLPGIGNYGKYDNLSLHYKLNAEFGNIIKVSDLKSKPDMIILFNPDDIEKAYRNEGVWPLREAVPSITHYRLKMREDVFQGQGGVLTSQGEEWFKVRSVISPPMMQPSAAQFYVETMDGVAQDFMKRVEVLRSTSPKGELPADFMNELNKWALESICVIALDKRLGLLDENSPDPEIQNFINDSMNMFELLNDLDFRPSLWKWVSTPTWRKLVKILDRVTAFEKKYLDETITKMQNEKQPRLPDSQMSILEKLLQKDKLIAFATSFDMLFAGIDTTSRSVAAALYYLSVNPRVQNKLRKELIEVLPSRDTPIKSKELEQLKYLRAVVKESMRLAPISFVNVRRTQKEIVLSGYQIPKGCDLFMSHMILCTKPEHFPKPQEFIPERWLREENNEYMHKDLNPFIFMPFGFGVRSCVGRRLANLEIETVIARMVRNYIIDWPHEPMEWKMTLMYGVGSPLKFHTTKVAE